MSTSVCSDIIVFEAGQGTLAGRRIDRAAGIGDDDWGVHQYISFTFLGYTFQPRPARGRNGATFTAFVPAISKDALKLISAQVRSWRLHLRTGQALTDLARAVNPTVRGWMQYYGAFYHSALSPLLRRINTYLVRWLRRKYKRLRGARKARRCWQQIITRCPLLFAHWKWFTSPSYSRTTG